MAVMSESEETQSGRLLISQPRERERERKKDEEEKRERERESRYPSLMMSLFIPPPVFKTHSALRVCGRRSNDTMR